MNWVAEASSELSLRQAREAVSGEIKPGNRNKLVERWASHKGSVIGWGANGDSWYWLYQVAGLNRLETYKMFDTSIAARAEFHSYVHRRLQMGERENERATVLADDKAEGLCPACGQSVAL